MDKLWNLFYEFMKYVDLFVSPVWNYFREMSGLKLFISTIIFIVIAFALFAITENCSLLYKDSIISELIPFADGYIWLARLMFLPMVAFLGLIFMFAGADMDTAFNAFVRTDIHVTLRNMAEWDMPFATIILLVVTLRCIAGMLYCVLTLDILEMGRFLSSILASILTGMCLGRVFLLIYSSHNHLILFVGHIVAIIVAFGAAAVFACALTAWIRDLFSPVINFIICILKVLGANFEIVLVDSHGFEHSIDNFYYYILFVMSSCRI